MANNDQPGFNDMLDKAQTKADVINAERQGAGEDLNTYRFSLRGLL